MEKPNETRVPDVHEPAPLLTKVSHALGLNNVNLAQPEADYGLAVAVSPSSGSGYLRTPRRRGLSYIAGNKGFPETSLGARRFPCRYAARSFP